MLLPLWAIFVHKSGRLWLIAGNQRTDNKGSSWSWVGGGDYSQLQQRRAAVGQDLGEGQKNSKSLPDKLWLHNACNSIPFEDGWCTLSPYQPSSLARQYWHEAWAVRLLQTLSNCNPHCSSWRSVPNNPGRKRRLLLLSWPLPPSPILFLSCRCSFWRRTLCSRSGVPMLCWAEEVAAWPKDSI